MELPSLFFSSVTHMTHMMDLLLMVFVGFMLFWLDLNISVFCGCGKIASGESIERICCCAWEFELMTLLSH